MAMTERVKRLRTQSLEAVESLSSERAELLTQFYQRRTGLGAPRRCSGRWLSSTCWNTRR